MSWQTTTRRRMSRLGRVRWPLASSVGRVRVLLLAIAVIFSLCAGRALQIQAFDARAYAAEAATAMRNTRELPALRGGIVDRYGAVLAYTEETVRVTASPKMILTNGKMDQAMTARDQQIAASAPQRIAEILARHLGETPESYLPKLTDRTSGYEIIKTKVAAETFAVIQAEMSAAGLVGLDREAAPTRRYPSGTIGANLIGWVNEAGDAAGGLELVLEKYLKGTDGKEVFDSSPNGKIPLGDNVLVPAVNGHTFTLTMDSALQVMAEQRLAKTLADTGAEAAAVIVMDPRTGELLVMANGPSFDSNDPGKGDLQNMGNRAAGNVFEPGSVQKILTFAALFDSGTAEADDKVKIAPFIQHDQYRIDDWWSHGTITMRARGVFAKSSNVGTITLARKMTKQQLVDYYSSFGLGRKTNLGVLGEAQGYLPKAQMPNYTRDGIAFGTSLSVTAVQNAAAVASVVNGGVYHAPTIISAMDGKSFVRPGQDTTARRVISPAASEQVRSLMEQQALASTSPAFRIDGYRIGTKTGTARLVSEDCGCYRGESVVSTIGVAPIENPQVLVYAVVWNPKYNGNSGSAVAAPIMHDVMALALPRYAVAPSAGKGVKLPLE